MERAVPVLPADDLVVAKETGLLGVERGGSCDEPWGARTFDVIDPFGNTIFVIGPGTRVP